MNHLERYQAGEYEQVWNDLPYLRLAILRWGGFPGLEGESVPFQPLAGLIADLEPF